MNKRNFMDMVDTMLRADFGKGIEKASKQEKYYAVAKTVMTLIADDWNRTETAYKQGKQACYLSAEFLMGRALGNNLINLGIYENVKEALDKLGIDIRDLESAEEDAGLGNGGLGRLAACFLDSCATLNLPVTGYGIRYRYGIFKQRFEKGFQVEEGDHWLRWGDPWSVPRTEDRVVVEFSDGKVQAIPYDMPILGYDTKNINTLRLWQAEPITEFDFQLFNNQKYDQAVREKNRAEDISRVLYPNDSEKEGKILRLKQQYFFVSASLQDMIRRYKQNHGKDFREFAQFHAVQLNDTHPVVAIPELMRLLTDQEGMLWDEAWKVTVKTFAYTNHTILAEALEQWDSALYRKLLPRIYQIIQQIDKQFVNELKEKGYSKEQIEKMRIMSKNRIRMAWLAIYGCHTTNGVAALHTKILIECELKDWYELYPERFQNKTNGVTPRRWLLLSNPELADLITELLGTKAWIKDLSRLKELEKYTDNQEVLERFMKIKAVKKRQLAAYIHDHEGILIDPNSIFDIQIKRLHEYKRQLLNAFHILDLYYRLKENPELEIVPRTFIFGAKAAPGYYRAKAVIKFINEIAVLVNGDPEIHGKIKVVFVQNYGVSYAEKLFPAADVSEQISTAGKEASGTGNMKFMLNGTPTLGTYDGANVEIVEEAGEANNFIFGARVEELVEIQDHYNPKVYYEQVPGLKRVIDALTDGTFDDGGTGMFQELHQSILEGAAWHKADNYFICRDFEDYRKAQQAVDLAYRQPLEWAKKCWLNLVNSGKFSTDRTIDEYAKKIWHIEPNKI
ncbi:maltodextrin phosphorylase [Geosporobacter subterraneus DSM 17957]|uniref:Alpha-1,4 glucan phosphorylase n=1 Tax=Geosporobacter subterraneus DSM 17957 TaxID=1121919 RepID=A0A1M6JBM1_9FIRM|nr:glycogen/starch/alpha-glucan phosphorylase [Geosporobacter subterraneus]SHJ44128.1 maltodextrin phosphorylase [Geosporobacter subterraneus DSM 17957]